MQVCCYKLWAAGSQVTLLQQSGIKRCAGALACTKNKYKLWVKGSMLPTSKRIHKAILYHIPWCILAFLVCSTHNMLLDSCWSSRFFFKYIYIYWLGIVWPDKDYYHLGEHGFCGVRSPESTTLSFQIHGFPGFLGVRKCQKLKRWCQCGELLLHQQNQFSKLAPTFQNLAVEGILILHPNALCWWRLVPPSQSRWRCIFLICN